MKDPASPLSWTKCTALGSELMTSLKNVATSAAKLVNPHKYLMG